MKKCILKFQSVKVEGNSYIPQVRMTDINDTLESITEKFRMFGSVIVNFSDGSNRTAVFAHQVLDLSEIEVDEAYTGDTQRL